MPLGAAWTDCQPSWNPQELLSATTLREGSVVRLSFIQTAVSTWMSNSCSVAAGAMPFADAASSGVRFGSCPDAMRVPTTWVAGAMSLLAAHASTECTCDGHTD